MPREITRTVWACDLCGCEFPTLEKALECESGGVGRGSQKLDDLFVKKSALEALLTGWWRGMPEVGAVEEVEIYRIVAGRLAKNSGSGSKGQASSHRLVYLLEGQSLDGLSESSAYNLKLDYFPLILDHKPEMVNLMLRRFRRLNPKIVPEVKSVAESAVEALIARGAELIER